MRAELKHLQHELKATTVYVTHDQIEAMTLAHRVAVMNGGVIEQLGTPRQIYNDPRTLFVAGFIGSPPMNLIEARSPAGQFSAAGSRSGGWAKLRLRRPCSACVPRMSRWSAPRTRRRTRRADLLGRAYRREHAGQRPAAIGCCRCAPTRNSPAISTRPSDPRQSTESHSVDATSQNRIDF